jgi:ATP phosphoribosyltransferase regulatory subunit
MQGGVGKTWSRARYLPSLTDADLRKWLALLACWKGRRWSSEAEKSRFELPRTELAGHRLPKARYNSIVNDQLRPPQALAHPLPAGLRDLLAEETFLRRSLARKILEHFALHTYDLVTPPVFELADVLEKGLGTLDPGDVLRFVEPESGEVCALRPDMTPQIARMVATRLSSQSPPIRLCYEGTIVRRRQGRARKHRQVPQAGVELYGAPAPNGDEEVLHLLASVSRCIGLESFVIDIGHSGISRSLIDTLPKDLAHDVTEALVHKDRARVASLLATNAAANISKDTIRALKALPDLSGGFSGRSGQDVLNEAKKVFHGTPAAQPLLDLVALWERIHALGAQSADAIDNLRLDLGEVRHFAYYTGIIFHAVAKGPGEPYASGGRYDDLLGRFGHPMPAIGFALHLDAVARARSAAGQVEKRPARVLVALESNGEEVVRQLRAEGIAAVSANGINDVDHYAATHGFTHIARQTENNDISIQDAEAKTTARVSPNELVSHLKQ